MTTPYHEKPVTAVQLLPTHAYTSQAWFDREQDELFSHCWTFAGMTDDVAEPGDFSCTKVGRLPMIVVHGKDGTLTAFHNRCRHRGTPVAEGRGNARHGLVCPYHAWTYDLDGSLRGMPKREELFVDLDLSCHGLVRGSIGVFRGVMFVHPDPDPAETFADFIAELPDMIGPHHPDTMAETGSFSYEIKANWKIVVENFMDGYHLPILHPKTAGGYDHERQEWWAVGRHWIFYQPLVEGKMPYHKKYDMTPVDGIDGKTYGAHVHMLFPNIGWVGSSANWSTFHAIPVAPDHTIVQIRARVMPESAAAAKAYYKKQGYDEQAAQQPITLQSAKGHPLESNDIMLEDMWICEQLQMSMNSPRYTISKLAPVLEASLTFHQRNVLDFVPLPEMREAAE